MMFKITSCVAAKYSCALTDPEVAGKITANPRVTEGFSIFVFHEDVTAIMDGEESVCT